MTNLSDKPSGASDQEDFKITPIEVEKYIKGVNFPADKEDLIHQAEGNHAPDEVMRVLNELTGKEYRSPVDIAKELSQNPKQ